jgi:hypothetical protein
MSTTYRAVHTLYCTDTVMNFECYTVPTKANTPTTIRVTDSIRLDELECPFERAKLIYVTRNYNFISLTSRDSCP